MAVAKRKSDCLKPVYGARLAARECEDPDKIVDEPDELAGFRMADPTPTYRPICQGTQDLLLKTGQKTKRAIVARLVRRALLIQWAPALLTNKPGAVGRNFEC
jgi:hypothetical protein